MSKTPKKIYAASRLVMQEIPLGSASRGHEVTRYMARTVNQIQVEAGNFMVQSCDLESFPTETNTNIFFCQCVLLSHFLSARKGNTKLTSLLYFIRPRLFV